MPNFVKIACGYIPLGDKFIPKITSFGDFDACKPIFESHNREVWREATDLGHPPHA